MKKISLQVICALLLFLFLYTGLQKLTTINHFRNVLTNAPATRPFAAVLAVGIPIIELITAVCLFFPRFRPAGLYTSFILMLCFTVYIGCMLAFASDLPCNCGGVLQSLSWPQHLVFNIFFLLLAITGIFLSKNTRLRKWKPPGHPAAAPLSET